jgi:hypothetical protein
MMTTHSLTHSLGDDDDYFLFLFDRQIVFFLFSFDCFAANFFSVCVSVSFFSQRDTQKTSHTLTNTHTKSTTLFFSLLRNDCGGGGGYGFFNIIFVFDVSITFHSFGLKRRRKRMWRRRRRRSSSRVRAAAGAQPQKGEGGGEGEKRWTNQVKH